MRNGTQAWKRLAHKHVPHILYVSVLGHRYYVKGVWNDHCTGLKTLKSGTLGVRSAADNPFRMACIFISLQAIRDQIFLLNLSASLKLAEFESSPVVNVTFQTRR